MAGSAVLHEHMMVFHMVVAALWGQSSVSGESGTQHHGLGRSGELSWLPALPLPTGPRWHHASSPALWGLAPEEQGGNMAAHWGAGRDQGWQREEPEDPGIVCLSDTWDRLYRVMGC